jgi:hypothetical protein
VTSAFAESATTMPFPPTLSYSQIFLCFQIIKEELKKDLENLRRKNQTEILEIKIPFSQTKNTVECHSSRLEQVEDRISELEDKIEIKGKKRNLSQTNQEL